MAPANPELTQLINASRDGDSDALNQLFPLIYQELHRLAHQQRRRQGALDTLNTTALLHEAYLKLVGSSVDAYADRTHFFRVAARAMRQITIDYARRSRRQKRGGDERDATFEEALLVPPEKAEEVLALDEALTRLAALHERQAEVVELRYFAGFTIEETADLLGTSHATTSRDWAAARAWLHRELSTAS